MRQMIAATIAVLLSAAPLRAQSPADLLFSSDAPCFGRIYDDAHMAAHPAQQVTDIRVLANVRDMALDSSDDLLLRVEVRTLKHPAAYTGTGICTDNGESLDCLMEGDAGGFSLTMNENLLQLDVGTNGLSFEGEADFLTLEHDSGDDRVFLLDDSVCRTSR